jgi:two-component system, LytTR family, response regulator
MNCIIIEDEPLAQEKLKSYIAKIPSLQLLEVYDSALPALEILKGNTVDLLFLDINLGEMSGIALLEHAKISAQVILTTAYPEYALKGYDLQVCDYLLKPFTLERFVQAVDRAQQIHTPKTIDQSPDFIFFKTENRLEKVFLDDILFIEGMGDYRRIHTKTQRIMVLQTFYDMEAILPETAICRVHKSYMVALDKIESIEKDRIRIAHHIIPISDTYRDSFYQKIRQM